ncbi:ABC transporter permease [Amphibacillus sp. Q70]|uniref:ABC transporter permease n=1 Tax=Amphibacillus sp. Q70 TaxID=3453416 RepID=UPI003F86F6EA
MRVNKFIKYVFIILFLLLVWWGIVVLFDVPSYIMPTPLYLLNYLFDYLFYGEMIPHIMTTLYEVLAGTALGIILGMVIGYLVAKSQVINNLLMPLILIFQISPKISIAPLFILWFGLGLTSKIVLVILVVSFPIIVNESNALKSINKDYIYLMKILKANRLQFFVKLELPFALSAVLSGIKVSVTQAMTGAVIGEMMGAKSGLGYLLTYGSEMFDINIILSSVIVLSIIGMVLYSLFDQIEKKLLYWR